MKFAAEKCEITGKIIFDDGHISLLKGRKG